MIQTTNIRRILDRIRRHKMLQDVSFETVIEHTVDFLQLMGTPALYQEMTAIVPVKNWRGELPCNFERMNQVRVAPTQHNNAWSKCPPVMLLPMYRESSNSFHMSEFKPDSKMTGEFTYKIEGLVIFTSTKDIDLEISYRGFMVDSEGFPLLPDNVSFLRGLENYIKMKCFEEMYEAGELPENVMNRVDREYCWSVGDAQNEFSRLSLDAAETLFNSFKTLLPRNHEHARGFATLGATEIWNH